MTNDKPDLDSSSSISKSTIKEVSAFFVGGAGAGLVAFALFGGIWQVTHFEWVMAATAMTCGLLAVLLRQNFKAMLNVLLENAPWI
ncbi:hypothetical protein [Sphaerothrix gracilis]|uniref:hypothetical protein n=1 Tax=Sphaerothrix gracilis TaxID=3151835 RepID=UPI0031FD0A45